ncbi:MAG TPA: hypothetical protein VGR06_30720 [Actinophytocola sp.]|uniref:hypothetical protein n=1 Tax=Actinophytocola sp. TaxID=1872138 RepID=UPI002DF8C5B9|nr:hypothetical protein [Actinophytocola sp.]
MPKQRRPRWAGSKADHVPGECGGDVVGRIGDDEGEKSALAFHAELVAGDRIDENRAVGQSA